jgi:HSP20 family protein
LNQVAEMIDRAFARTHESGKAPENHGWTLPVDVFERDNNLIVRTALPGVKPEDVNVSIEENVLTISGETKEEITDHDKVFRREYRHGKFSRSLLLPENIDTAGVEASFDNGYVRITLPKVEPVKPEALKIPVKYVVDAPAEAKESDETTTA